MKENNVDFFTLKFIRMKKCKKLRNVELVLKMSRVGIENPHICRSFLVWSGVQDEPDTLVPAV